MSQTFGLLDLFSPRSPTLLYDRGPSATSSHVMLRRMAFLKNESSLTDLIYYRLCEYVNFKAGSMSMKKFSSVSPIFLNFYKVNVHWQRTISPFRTKIA